MKILMLSFVFIFFTISVFSQAKTTLSKGCRCDGLINSCTAKCDSDEIADCHETWYGGCSCNCQEKIDPGDTNPVDGDLQAFNLRHVKLLKSFISEKQYYTFNRLVRKLNSKRKKGNGNIVL